MIRRCINGWFDLEMAAVFQELIGHRLEHDRLAQGEVDVKQELCLHGEGVQVTRHGLALIFNETLRRLVGRDLDACPEDPNG